MSVAVIFLIVAAVMFFVAGFQKLVFNPPSNIDFMNLGFAFVVLSWIVAAQ